MRETETVESPEHLELESACQEKDRAAISKLIEAIPADRWTVIPERATCLSGPLTVQVWRDSGGSGINTYEAMERLYRRSRVAALKEVSVRSGPWG